MQVDSVKSHPTLSRTRIDTASLHSFTPSLTWVTLPSRPLYFPRTMRTSSSLRMGMERAPWAERSSLERGEDMILRFCPEEAEKCALRDLRRSEARPGVSMDADGGCRQGKQAGR